LKATSTGVAFLLYRWRVTNIALLRSKKCIRLSKM